MPTFRPILRYPEIDGHRLSRTSCQFRIDPFGGTPFVVNGWKSIKPSHSLTPGKTWGNRAKVQGRTRGKYECSMELEIYQEDAEVFRVALGLAGATQNLGWMETRFNTVVTGFERILGGAFVWQGIGGRITKEDMGPEDNDDQMSVKWSVDLTDIIMNGLSAVNESTSTGLPG